LNPATGKCNAINKSWVNFNGNNQGFWLFSREKKVSPETLKVMRDTADSLGLDVGALIKVEQEGCPEE